MKKLIPVLALVFVFAACNNKNKEEKKPEADSVTNTTTPTTTTDATDPAPSDLTGSRTSGNTSTTDIPTFSDPDVQKFVNEYTEFVRSYKQGIIDPAKARDLANEARKWNTKMGFYAQKLSANPDDLEKWRTWAEAMSKEMTVTK